MKRKLKLLFTIFTLAAIISILTGTAFGETLFTENFDGSC